MSELDDLKARVAELEKANQPPEPARPKVDYSFAQSNTARMAMDRATMDRSTTADFARAVGDDLVRAIVGDQRRGVSQLSSTVTSNAPTAPVQRGSGWRDPAPLEVPGLKYVDELCSAQDRVDLVERAEKLAKAEAIAQAAKGDGK